MAIICNTARDFICSFEWLFYENSVAEFRDAHLRNGGMRPDEIWGSRSEMGAGFAFRTHTSIGRCNALFVLKEAREALSLTELDAIMAHEMAHLELGHLEEVGDAFEKKTPVPALRRFKMELEADRVSMRKTSPQALYSGLLTILTATEFAVGGVDPGCEEKFVKEHLKKDLELRVRLGVIRARVAVDKIRSWFGR